ncbi:hypothetical protein CMEL01_16142 [Colletotrichum melonis]|uniref:Uncharacterized protein n=1 Tax=Colletotrichum melonis TaxID=1209925 RepID=A0AAI9UE85_9PEZI|nr:hypothetical protein CMEL01_16142 [Colletotrichum melonis]
MDVPNQAYPVYQTYPPAFLYIVSPESTGGNNTFDTLFRIHQHHLSHKRHRLLSQSEKLAITQLSISGSFGSVASSAPQNITSRPIFDLRSLTRVLPTHWFQALPTTLGSVQADLDRPHPTTSRTMAHKILDFHTHSFNPPNRADFRRGPGCLDGCLVLI